MVYFGSDRHRVVLYRRRQGLSQSCGIACRHNLPYTVCKGQSGRSGADDSFQHYVRDSLVSFRYYGEMMTYLGMTAPMAVFSLVSWLKNPYEGNRSEVRLDSLSKRSGAVMAVLTVVVTALFYFILKELGTANIIPSTISVATSFIAAYLTFKRSRFLSFAYAMNDIVLIILWTAASFADISYITVDICFVVFFANDMYGFINLTRIARRQKTDK